MDDSLATVIPFPVRHAHPVQPGPADPDALEDYWARVQRLAAERRRLVTTAAR